MDEIKASIAARSRFRTGARKRRSLGAALRDPGSFTPARLNLSRIICRSRTTSPLAVPKKRGMWFGGGHLCGSSGAEVPNPLW